MKTLLLAGLLLFTSYVLAADDMTVNVAQGQKQFQIILPSNPSTGYQWSVKGYDKSLIKLVSSQYSAPKTQLIGAGGQMVFTFEQVKSEKLAQTSKVNLIYARPWQPEQGTLKSVTIHFNANSPSS